MEDPQRPLTVVMGGAKVSDKLPIIQNLLPLANNLIITGGMIFTFLKALHPELKIGHSLFEAGKEDYIHKVLQEAKQHNVNIYFPEDFKSAPIADFKNYLANSGNLTETAPTISTVHEGIHPDYIGLDIGPETVSQFKRVLSESSCVALNGPSGLIETEFYRQGTIELFNHISDLTSAKRDFISVIGGGDSVNAIRFCKGDARFSHVSTGGGASLEMLEGKKLPGIYSLSDKN